MPLDSLLDRFGELPATRSLIDRLPAPGRRIGAGGLPGSSPAVLVATLARQLPQRVFTVVAPTPADGERWLADLQTLLGPDGPALYPQRESLGAEEPHYELAGERIETLEALLRGSVRVLVTTARASAERTAVPAALEQSRLVIEVSKEERRLTDTTQRLDAMGYTRVPTVTEVAQYSIRGGILDVYGFGMAMGSAWLRRRGSSGGVMKSRRCAASISTRSARVKRWIVSRSCRCVRNPCVMNPWAAMRRRGCMLRPY